MAEVIDKMKLELFEKQSQTIKDQAKIIHSQEAMINELFRVVALMLTSAELEQLKLFEKLQRTQNLKNALERAEQ